MEKYVQLALQGTITALGWHIIVTSFIHTGTHGITTKELTLVKLNELTRHGSRCQWRIQVVSKNMVHHCKNTVEITILNVEPVVRLSTRSPNMVRNHCMGGGEGKITFQVCLVVSVIIYQFVRCYWVNNCISSSMENVNPIVTDSRLQMGPE